MTRMMRSVSEPPIWKPVVIVRHHADERRLAHAPRPEEDDVPECRVLDVLEEGRLVYIEVPSSSNFSKICDAVRDFHHVLVLARGRVPPMRTRVKTVRDRIARCYSVLGATVQGC